VVVSAAVTVVGGIVVVATVVTGMAVVGVTEVGAEETTDVGAAGVDAGSARSALAQAPSTSSATAAAIPLATGSR